MNFGTDGGRVVFRTLSLYKLSRLWFSHVNSIAEGTVVAALGLDGAVLTDRLWARLVSPHSLTGSSISKRTLRTLGGADFDGELDLEGGTECLGGDSGSSRFAFLT